MQFGLSEEQIMLRDNINRFLDDNSSLDRVRAFADGGDDADIWAGLAELGVPALLVPEEQGGIGLTPLDAAIVAECLGAHIAPTPFLGTAVMAPTALAASDGDRSAWRANRSQADVALAACAAARFPPSGGQSSHGAATQGSSTWLVVVNHHN